MTGCEDLGEGSAIAPVNPAAQGSSAAHTCPGVPSMATRVRWFMYASREGPAAHRSNVQGTPAESSKSASKSTSAEMKSLKVKKACGSTTRVEVIRSAFRKSL